MKLSFVYNLDERVFKGAISYASLVIKYAMSRKFAKCSMIHCCLMLTLNLTFRLERGTQIEGERGFDFE